MSGLAWATTLLLAGLTQCRMATAQMGMGNTPPYAQNDTSGTMEETPVSIAVLNNDHGMSAPLNPASVHIVSGPTYGVASVDPSTGDVWYIPGTEFWGGDSLTYTVTDTLGHVSNVATVTIWVMPDPTPPVIESLSATLQPGGRWTISGTVSDDDPAGVIVYFGGYLSGLSADVNPNGTFSVTVSVSAGQYVTFTAQAVNEEGVPSTTGSGYIDNR